MNTVTKHANSNDAYAQHILHHDGGLFLNKETRDAVAEILKARGLKVNKSSTRNQRVHPEYIIDFIGTYETGFGNSDYMRYWNVLYKVDFTGWDGALWETRAREVRE